MSALPGLADLVSTRAYTNTALIGVDDLSAKQKTAVPDWILESVRFEGPEGITVATAHWEATVPGLLDDAIQLFRDRAVGTYLGRVSGDWGGFLVLIYVLRGDTQPYVCWYGYLPTGHLDNRTVEVRPGVKADLTQVSEAQRAFYTRIHNRFRLIGSGECGLPPLDELFTLEGEPDDFDYRGGGDQRPEPEQLLPVFLSNNGHLCVELGTENAWKLNGSTLEAVGEVWSNIDEWIRRFTVECL